MIPPRLTLTLLFILGSLLPLSAETTGAESLFYQANILAAEESFDQAISLYEAALAQRPSPNLHYNLGHAYYQTGDWSRARLQWERALAMAPGHASARHNLEWLLQEQNLPSSTTSFERLIRILSLNQWIWAGVASFWTVLAGLILARWKRAPRLLAVTGLGAVGVITCGVAIALSQPGFSEAILLEDQISLRVAPAPASPVATSLSAAQSVRIVGAYASFYRVRLPDGQEGFIQSDQLERIR